MASFPGTDGYAAEAPVLLDRYERQGFEAVHASILHLLPAPGLALDVGAGTGRDAAALAARGFDVVAVEPTAEMRASGRRLHPDLRIEWIDDGLPQLTIVRTRGDAYDLVLCTAVWMHLDQGERAVAAATLASMVAAGGVLSVTLRRGPVPAGRRIFHVEAAELIAQMQAFGLDCVLDRDEPAIGAENVAAGVHWRRVAFRRP